MTSRSLSLLSLVILAICSTSGFTQAFTDVTLGHSHICAIVDTAEVECTTTASSQRYGAPDDLPLMTDIAAGEQHTCGIDLDGQAVCWGGEGFGAFDQLRVPAITQPLVSIGAGDNHTCAIDVNGRVWCWGLDTNQQSQPPGDGLGENGGGFIKVDGGVNFSCGIQTDGDIACWTNDTRMGDTSNIPGPFIDLDLSSNNACGLKSDGMIDCWFSQVSPPDNGPYTDLVVSRFAVCGLDEEQVVECSYDSRYAPEEPVFSTDSRFTAIESGAEVFSPGQPFCGLTISGSIECSSSNQFDALPTPGVAGVSGSSLATVQLAPTARIYARNQIELFWNHPPLRFGREQILIEIYRNDVLVDTTENSTSWYDPTEQSQRPVVYQIRAIDQQGNTGPFSSTVTVDDVLGTVAISDTGNRFDIVQPAHTVDSLTLQLSGNSYVLLWSGSQPGMDGLKGYEIRVNNEAIVFIDGFLHRLQSFNSSDCNKISVAAVSDNGTIFDYRTIVTNRFSRNYSSCSNYD